MHRFNPEIDLMAILNLKKRGKGLCPIYFCMKYVDKVYNTFLPAFHIKDLCSILIGYVCKRRNNWKASESDNSAVNSREGVFAM